MTRVVALVAARDEGDRIAETVLGLRAIPSVTDVVAVDDGSYDDTSAQALAAGARVLRSERSRGKGGALEAVLDRIPEPDVWLLADGDLGASASALEPLIEAVTSGEAELTIAVVPPGDGGGFGLVKRAAGLAIRRLGGTAVREPLSGQRALTAAAMRAVRPLAAGFGLETAMTIDAVRAGLRVHELPVPVTHRPTYRDVAGFAHRARQGLDIGRAVAVRALGRR